MNIPDDIWCVIPVYNNGETIREVALGCRKKIKHVLVIDDGSTDVNVTAVLADTDITVIRHTVNRGKGRALAAALDFVVQKNARYMITLDGDGQHKPEDLDHFIAKTASGADDTLWIGVRDFSKPNIPGKSKFGRDFANFWLRIETGIYVADCQSGFRAYPVRYFKDLKFSGCHYDFETEALARAAWAGIKLKTVDIDVWYAEPGKRISHFRPFKDNFRISMMHARLVLRHLLPWPHKRLIPKQRLKPDYDLFLNPVRFFKMLMRENASPLGLAASAAVGIIGGTLPLIATHTVFILYVSAKLHLNKVLAATIQILCSPPLIPFVCIELGYYMRCGAWMTEFSKENFIRQIPFFIWDWFLGSLIVAPVFALICAAGVYWIAKSVQHESVPAGGDL